MKNGKKLMLTSKNMCASITTLQNQVILKRVQAVENSGDKIAKYKIYNEKILQ